MFRFSDGQCRAGSEQQWDAAFGCPAVDVHRGDGTGDHDNGLDQCGERQPTDVLQHGGGAPVAEGVIRRLGGGTVGRPGGRDAQVAGTGASGIFDEHLQAGVVES